MYIYMYVCMYSWIAYMDIILCSRKQKKNAFICFLIFFICFLFFIFFYFFFFIFFYLFNIFKFLFEFFFPHFLIPLHGHAPVDLFFVFLFLFLFLFCFTFCCKIFVWHRCFQMQFLIVVVAVVVKLSYDVVNKPF